MMDSRDEEERELDDDLDDSFDSEAMESELEAQLIEEWCPVCGEIKPHAVIAGGKIACAACNHEHRREVESTSSKPVVQSLLTAEDMASEASLAEAWKRLTDVEEGDIQPYSIRLKLSEGVVIRHSKFGVGVVIKMTDTTKAEVLFSDGMRRLVCGK